jgi:hypothetical protein
VNPRRLRIGEWIVGLGGVLLLAATFVNWFEIDGGEASRTAWEAFTVIDLMLALTAGMAIGVAVMAAAHNSPAVPLALASLLALVGLITTIVVVVRAIALPDLGGGDVAAAAGLWLGLGAIVLTTLGAFAAMRDERFPRGARVEVPVETLPPPEGGKA